MKYYIPTTTLNFNCILSTESISPAEFYPTRGFGYSRWTAIPENGKVGVVLLYDKPFSFVRPKSDLEDHPMMIELDTDESFGRLKEGVFASPRTIYLDPYRSRFIFFSEEDKATALSASTTSLETKMVQVYSRRMAVETFDKLSIPLDGLEDRPIDETAVEYDRRLNKMKGLLYGYYIGAMMSASAEDVKSLNGLREIQNILSSIVSSPDHKPSDTQREVLGMRLHELKRTEPVVQKLEMSLGSSEKVDEVLNILEDEGRGFPHEYEYKTDKLLLKISCGQEDEVCRWISARVESQEQKMHKRQSRLSVGAAEILLENDSGVRPSACKLAETVLPDQTENRLFLSWANDTLARDAFNGNIGSARKTLADKLTIKAKEVLGQDWNEGSAIKIYLNALRHHIAGEAFKQPWLNGLLSSLAAVLLKGDDWQGLLRFLQGHGLTDYRIAFAIYGELNGFANLGRDFTDLLIDLRTDESKKYFAEVYQEFYGQLHGVALKNYKLNPVDSSANENIGLLRDQVISYFNSAGFLAGLKHTKTSVSDLRKGLELALDDMGDSQDAKQLIETLFDKYSAFGWKKRTKAGQLIQVRFAPSLVQEKTSRRKKPEKKSEKTPYTQPQLPLPTLFSEDLGVAQDLHDLVCTRFSFDIDRANTMIEDLRYIQKRHAPNGRDINEHRENGEAVLHFMNLVSQSERPQHPIERGSEEYKVIYGFLKSRYGIADA